MRKYTIIMLGMILGCSFIKAQTNIPSDNKATKSTVALYQNLKKQMQKGVMVGHQDAFAYGIGWYAQPGRCDVKDASGCYPAVFGWDLGGIEHGKAYNLDSVSFKEMRRYVQKVYRMGAVNTFSWHLDNLLTGKSAWDASSDQVVKSVLPGGSKHEEFRQWLDQVAGFFLSLKDDKGKLIPVIFRPFHEHTGSWFWWGKKLCTEEQYKEMSRFSIDYLRNTKKVHNLLIAYSSGDFTTDTDFVNRYPGDKYVDIVGFDHYQYGMTPEVKTKFISSLRYELGVITDFAQKHNKIPALTETGLESLPDSTWFTSVLTDALKGYKVSYVLLWRNAYNRKNHFYIPYPGHSSVKDFNRFIASPDVLMQDKVRNLYK